jgi:hypothetical protein
MAVAVTVCALALFAVIVLVVSAPLREAAARRAGTARTESAPEEAEGWAEGERLEVAREVKYREIRDAEMDYRTGKLSERDYRQLDAELRGEALEILDALEAEGLRAGMERRPDRTTTPTAASEARSRSRRTGPRRRPSSD